MSAIPKSILMLLSTAFMLTMNGLANGLPLNGKTTGELSAQYPNWFVPAGVTFSIWGVLYLLMIGYVGMRIFKSREETDGIEGYYMLTAVLNGSWILAWHYEWMFASLLIMAGLLATLVWMGERIRAAGESASTLTKATFGMYLGWIMVATVANVTAALVSTGWDGFGIGGPVWAAILVVVALLGGIRVHRLFGNPYILISITWAFLGILIKQAGGDADIVLYAVALAFGAMVKEMATARWRVA